MSKDTADVGEVPEEEPSKLFTWLTLILALVSAALARKAVSTTWRLATGKEPPEDPADPDVEAREAIAWALLTAVAIGIARLLAQRKMAGYYKDSLGKRPPHGDTKPRELNQLRG